ncbi:MAG: arylformamidase [Gammaproteobacteria bacterium]|jgi:arylformamidase
MTSNDKPTQPIYLDYDQQQLDAQYDQGTLIKDVQRYERAWRDGSAAATERLTVRRDVAYGDSPAQKLDLFLPAGEGPFPVVAFFHGGGWTRHGKEKFAFPAPAFIDHDIAFACVGFDMLPKVTVPQIAAQCRQAIDWLLANAPDLKVDADALFVAGHSSGAHLAAATLALNDGAPPPDIKGALLLSGVYDLQPLLLSARNEALQLTEELVRTLSPINNIPTDPCPLVVACGGGELDEFQRQSAAFAQAWETAGGAVQLINYSRHNHFSMTEELADATGEAMQGFLEMIEQRI